MNGCSGCSPDGPAPNVPSHCPPVSICQSLLDLHFPLGVREPNAFFPPFFVGRELEDEADEMRNSAQTGQDAAGIPHARQKRQKDLVARSRDRRFRGNIRVMSVARRC